MKRRWKEDMDNKLVKKYMKDGLGKEGGRKGYGGEGWREDFMDHKVEINTHETWIEGGRKGEGIEEGKKEWGDLEEERWGMKRRYGS